MSFSILSSCFHRENSITHAMATIFTGRNKKLQININFRDDVVEMVNSIFSPGQCCDSFFFFLCSDRHCYVAMLKAQMEPAPALWAHDCRAMHFRLHWDGNDKCVVLYFMRGHMQCIFLRKQRKRNLSSRSVHHISLVCYGGPNHVFLMKINSRFASPSI